MTANRSSYAIFWAITILVGLCIPARAIQTVNGSITPNNIEIDNSTDGANLYPTSILPSNVENSTFVPLVDWVKDNTLNTDSTAGYLVNGKLYGHWYGGRIVDGIGTADQDIFLKGGKENVLASWDNVGAGSVGSSKYDITQVYMANNQNTLFFGMERRGNNGTTAFVFEFNQNPPIANSSGNVIVPNRTEGDVEFVFEMQGSGGSGSATGYYSIFHNGSYPDPTLLANGIYKGLFTGATINQIPTMAAPWGTVDAKGNWSNADIDKYEFAEAAVGFGNGAFALPGVNACGGHAYVQVRTRASAGITSDLKDTTPYFLYLFGGPTAKATLAPKCSRVISFSGAGSKTSDGNTDTLGTNLTYSWVFQKLDSNGNVVATYPAVAGQTGTWTAPSAGTYNAKLTVTETTGCDDPATADSVTVYDAVTSSLALSTTCQSDNTFSYAVTPGGGNGTYTIDLTIEKLVNAVWTAADTKSNVASTGTLDVTKFAGANGTGTYRVTAKVTDTQKDSSNVSLNCYATDQKQIDAKPLLTASASKTSASGSALSVLLTGTVSDSSASLQWEVSKDGTDGSWTSITNQQASTITFSDFENQGTKSATTFTIGTDSYSGSIYTVYLRLHASRALNSDTCNAYSSAVAVKKVVAVDP